MKLQRPAISVQWHITTQCTNRCQHCYMYDERTYQSERDNTLSTQGLIQVLDGFEAFEKKWDVDISNFAISGGDPLLRDDWKIFLKEMQQRGKQVRLMGNPDALTEQKVKDMADLGVLVYQMSLDGLEETHDRFRSPGSFKRTVNALELLQKYGIQRSIMFTLYPDNADELIPLMRFVADHTCASTFSFDVGSFVGNALQLKQMFTPARLQAHFADYLQEKKRLREEDNPITLIEKSNLLRLSRFEEGTFYPMNLTSVPVISGCLAGWNSVAVLSDGTVMACRRLPITSGKMPEQSFEEIFLNNEFMRRLRRADSFEQCGSCDFYQVCRGCPANVYGVSGDPFSKNPFCFRSDVPKSTDFTPDSNASPPLDISTEEEFTFFASRFVMMEREKIRQLMNDPGLCHAFADLVQYSDARRKFLNDPYGYLQSFGCQPDEEYVFFLISHFILQPLRQTMEAQTQMKQAKQKFEALVLERHRWFARQEG